MKCTTGAPMMPTCSSLPSRPMRQSSGACQGWWQQTRRSTLGKERGRRQSQRRQADLHPKSLDQEPRAPAGTKEALVPRRPEMANGMRGPDQRREAATRSGSLPIQGLQRNAPLGRAGRHRRQSGQHRLRLGAVSRHIADNFSSANLNPAWPTSAGSFVIRPLHPRPENVTFAPGSS